MRNSHYVYLISMLCDLLEHGLCLLESFVYVEPNTIWNLH